MALDRILHHNLPCRTLDEVLAIRRQRATGPTALAEMEAEGTGETPFHASDRVLLRRDPQTAWEVSRCAAHPRGGFYLWFTDGGCGRAEGFVLCPQGWEDAPVRPSGCVRFGLSEDARQAKLAHDAADPLYRADLRLWCRQMQVWCDRWLRLIDPAEADRGVAFYRAQIDEMAGDGQQAAE